MDVVSGPPTDLELLLQALGELQQRQLQVLGELQQLRAELRCTPPLEALMRAIQEEFGTAGSFTCTGLLSLAEQEPLGDLARALEALIDANAGRHGRAIALGRVLQRAPLLEIVGRRAGVTLYRLAGG